MKRMGLIGGLSPESTIHYYQRAVILGCTELSLLIQESDTLLPLYDTTRIHAEAILEFSLREQTAAEDEEEPSEPFSPVCYLKEFKPE